MKRACCSSCGAVLLWATTTSGKRIPLDYEPDVNGAFVIHNVTSWSPVRAVAATLEDAHLPHYTTHFATCPNATAHRKKRAHT